MQTRPVPLPASAPELIRPSQSAALLTREDLRNLGLLLAGFVAMVLVVSPVRSFPIDDDWTYARAVGDLLNWSYRNPDWAQPTSIGHVAWGALFSLLFGNNFTTLSIANLGASAVCLLALYLLLRHLRVSARSALLGMALLGLNPIYIYLSYTFMTDITFMTFAFLGLLGYVRGMQGHGTRWMWLGSIAASLSYLTRQLGLLLPAAALIYLWWSGGWSWRKAAAITVLPVAALGMYTLWESTQPTSLATYGVGVVWTTAVQHPVFYALYRIQALGTDIIVPGLSLVPLIRRPRRLSGALVIFAILASLQVRSELVSGTVFPVSGSIVDNTGYLTCCRMAPVWTEPVWFVVAIVGAGLLSIFLWEHGELAWIWLRSRPWRRRAEDPVLLAYTFGALVAVVTLLISPVTYDRYLLPLVPFLALPGLRRMDSKAGQPARQWLWLALLPLALFALAAQHDVMVRMSARWQLAQNIMASGVPSDHIYAGYEWEGWYLYREGERRILEKGDFSNVPFPPNVVLDSEYMVVETGTGGYTEIDSRPYISWLNAGETHRMLLVKRK